MEILIPQNSTFLKTTTPVYKDFLINDRTKEEYEFSFQCPINNIVRRLGMFDVTIQATTPVSNKMYKQLTIKTISRSWVHYNSVDTNRPIQTWFLEMLQKTYPNVNFSTIKTERISVKGKNYVKIYNLPTKDSNGVVPNSRWLGTGMVYYVPVWEPKILIGDEGVLYGDNISIILGSLEIKRK